MSKKIKIHKKNKKQKKKGSEAINLNFYVINLNFYNIFMRFHFYTAIYTALLRMLCKRILPNFEILRVNSEFTTPWSKFPATTSGGKCQFENFIKSFLLPLSIYIPQLSASSLVSVSRKIEK